MPDLPSIFSQFELKEEHVSTFNSEFKSLLTQTDLSRCNLIDEIIATYKQASGIYFWIMKNDERLFCIYIGKTKSMSNRIKNYISDFQPHSPNDYKLRIFRTFMIEVAPKATLELYFSAKNSENLTKAENDAVGRYDPLLNRRQLPHSDSRTLLRDAFSVYYRSAFERLLKKSD